MKPNNFVLFLVFMLAQAQSAIAITLGESTFAAGLPVNSLAEQCLNEVTSHPLAQGLINHDYDEYVDFCNCLQEKTPKQPPVLEQMWQDPEKLLAPRDRCAVISLSKENLERYFFILLTTRFELFVYDKIVRRFPAGTSAMASPSSLATRTDCIQKNILYKCSKVYAFALTYQCIQDIFQTEELYAEASALCPGLSTEEIPLIDHPGSRML